MIREDKLDPDQRQFINVEAPKNGNVWIKGFAGSGKSVLLVHALKEILKGNSSARVCVVVFTHSLIDLFRTGMAEVGISSSVPVITYYDFEKSHNSYDYIFCDEVQDLPERVLQSMRNRSTKVFVAGDSNQSIYDVDPKWRESVVTPGRIGSILSARAFDLNIIHRLTRSIINAVQKLLPNMNIWGARRDDTKIDVNIRICKASNINKEVKYVWEESQKGPRIGETSVILLPIHKSIVEFINELSKVSGVPPWSFKPISWDSAKPRENQRPDYDDVNRYFSRNGLKIQYVGSKHGSLKNAENNNHVILMTYHSSKGLDFDNVFLPMLNSSLFLGYGDTQTLFMVAMTRSKKNLYISYNGYALHSYVNKFESTCSKINIDTAGAGSTSNRGGFNFDF